MSGPDLSGFSMLDLFRQEAESQTRILNDGLLAVENDPSDMTRLEALMRAAHSIKGAARIVGLDAAVGVAHAMEDCFVAAQKGEFLLHSDDTDTLLRGVDMLGRIATAPEAEMTAWKTTHQEELEALLAQLATVGKSVASAQAADVLPPTPTPTLTPPTAPPPPPAASEPAEPAHAAPEPPEGRYAVRVASANLSRMLEMIGETMVQSRWYDAFALRLLTLKNKHVEFSRLLEHAVLTNREHTGGNGIDERLSDMQRKMEECQRLVHGCLEEFDDFARRSSDLAGRLYRESLHSRMQPFSDGVHAFPRMVRDLAKQLGKKVRFNVTGETTGVDREILEKLEAPLTHILRNALDHGLETPEERLAAGKPETGSLTLEARHHAGLLYVTVADDGRGVDIETIRRKVISRGYCTPEVAGRLTESEVLDFLFLPGFSTAQQVTELSGRGVGMDVVHTMMQEIGGTARIETKLGEGTRIAMQLPVTLSVLRVLLVEIVGEPFALPLARIDRLLMLHPSEVHTLEGRPYVALDDRNAGLVDPREALALTGAPPPEDAWAVVVISDRTLSYGLIVSRFLGECNLVVRPLDPRFGKVQDVSAVSLMEDGTPVIILDCDDLIRTIDNLLHEGRLRSVGKAAVAKARARKRILVADDSITIREMERRLLENTGYDVEVAVDGADAWNKIRTNRYDLLVSDVDMPRMNGIELVQHVKLDAQTRALPVIIVSYKDSEDDRLRGMNAGANYYLTKSSFHDETFINAVADLIGGP